MIDFCKATEYGDMEARKALAQQQKELSKAQARMTELDTLFRKLYEDNALGRLTDERFVFRKRSTIPRLSYLPKL